MKRFERPLVGFLSLEEINAILEAPDPTTWSGRRDRAMFAVLYNTGAHVRPTKSQENHRVFPRQAFITAIAITHHNDLLQALVQPAKIVDGDIATAARRHGVIDHRGGLAHPKIPAIADFAFNRFKHFPAGLVIIKQLLAQLFFDKLSDQRLEQGGEPF